MYSIGLYMHKKTYAQVSINSLENMNDCIVHKVDHVENK